MKKAIKTGLLLMILFLLTGAFSPGMQAKTAGETTAEDILKNSGVADMTAMLPASAREALEELGWDSSMTEESSVPGLSAVLTAIFRQADKDKASFLVLGASMLGVMLLCAMVNAFSLGEKENRYLHTVTVLASAGLLVIPLAKQIGAFKETVDTACVFIGSFVPVYGGVLLAGGSTAGSTAYQTTLLLMADGITHGVKGIVVPALGLCLSLGLTGTVSPGAGLDAVGNTVYKTMLWGIGLVSTLFSGFLSFQQMVTAAQDSVQMRAMKYSIAGLVPVVGGALSEAYSTVAGCVSLLKTTVGCFGVLAVGAILLPSFIRLIGWSLCLTVGEMTAGLFAMPELERLMHLMHATVRVMIALLAMLGLLMVISTVVVVFAGKGLTV